MVVDISAANETACNKRVVSSSSTTEKSARLSFKGTYF